MDKRLEEAIGVFIDHCDRFSTNRRNCIGCDLYEWCYGSVQTVDFAAAPCYWTDPRKMRRDDE